MNVYIIRDAVEIGNFPREDIERLARSGQLQPGDYYWHEGMNEWLLLPELIGKEAWETASEQQTSLEPQPVPVWEPIREPQSLPEPDLPPEPEQPVTTEEKSPPPATETPAVLSIRFGQGARDWLIAHRRAAAITAGAVGLLIIVAIALHSRGEKKAAIAGNGPPKTAEANVSDADIRKKASTQLTQAIDRLPVSARSPLYVFYYGFTIQLARANSPYALFTAIIHGNENSVDPDTDATIRRTEFFLTADYYEGDWIFKGYDAVEVDTVTGKTSEIHDDARAPVPPDLVGILGLRRIDR